MILPRSVAARNATGLAVILLVALLGGCTHRLAHPPNVTLPDAHTVGHRVAFNRASDTLASAGSEGHVRLWRLPDGQALADWKAHEGSIYGLLFLDRERLILSAGHDGSLALWESDGRLRERRVTDSPVTDLAGDDEARRVVTGHADGTVRVWQLPELIPISRQQRHNGAVRAVAFHPGTQRYASSGRDGHVYVWRGSEPARDLPAPPGDAHQLAFSPDGRDLAGSGWFRLYRWSLAERSTLTVLPTEHWGAISALQYTRDGKEIATISRETDSAVDLLDARTGVVTRRFLPHDLCGAYVRLSPDGRYLATTSDDASVRLWDLRRLRAPQ